MRRQRRARKRQEKGEDRRPILKKLRVAHLRSFRRQQGEKIVCARGIFGVTRILGKVNSHADPTQSGVGDRTTKLRQLLIGAAIFFLAV